MISLRLHSYITSHEHSRCYKKFAGESLQSYLGFVLLILQKHVLISKFLYHLFFKDIFAIANHVPVLFL